MLLHPKWLPWKGLMTASFGRAFPGLGLAACVQHCLPTRVTVGLPQRHAAYLQAFRQLGAHRSVGHLSMTKEQIALEPLQGNHSVAQEDGLAFFPSASLPQELRGHSFLGQVPAASLTLLKLPATWSAKLSGPFDCPWAVNSARTYAPTVQRFQSWWCAEDVLASTQLVVGGQPRMVLKLSRFSVPGLPL